MKRDIAHHWDKEVSQRGEKMSLPNLNWEEKGGFFSPFISRGTGKALAL